MTSVFYRFPWLNWLVSVLAAVAAFLATAALWEPLIRFLVDFFIPETYEEVTGIENPMNSITSSLPYLIFVWITRPLVSVFSYYRVGLIIIDKKQIGDAPLVLLIIFLIFFSVVYSSTIVDVQGQGFEFNTWVIITMFIEHIGLSIYFFARHRNQYKLADGIVQQITQKNNQVKEPSAFKEKVVELGSNILGIAAMAYVAFAHCYFFYALWQYSKLHSFVATITAGIAISIWKAIFWIFYI